MSARDDYEAELNEFSIAVASLRECRDGAPVDPDHECELSDWVRACARELSDLAKKLGKPQSEKEADMDEARG